jgi:hypothetical protein
MASNCDISSVSTLSVSNFQNYNQRIEAVSNPTGRRAERISSSMNETIERSVLLLGPEFQRKITDSSCRATPMKITDALFKGDIAKCPLPRIRQTDRASDISLILAR